jgi:alkylation response protein AidB-like acyl-CoA dehydrogenase
MTTLNTWLRDNAEQLDRSEQLAEAVLPRLAANEQLRIGVPVSDGGGGGDAGDAIAAIAAVAQQSVTAAFVFWGQRSFVEYLLQSPNAALRERLLPGLLSGTNAGATGLSNTVKFLSGIEQLQIQATPRGQSWSLDGNLAWVTNLRKAGFVAAAAVAMADGAAPAVVAISSTTAGVQRSSDLDLIALRGSNTAAVKLEAVECAAADVISADARGWLPLVRPAFLGMQCGLSVGLARASLAQAASVSTSGGSLLASRIQALQKMLEGCCDALLAGVRDGSFKTQAPLLFRLRIELAELVRQALMLELQAMGGRAYLEREQDGFARRWRESAIIPVLTPSVLQLQAALDQHAQRCA